jgi:hypothetical protein
VGGRGEGIKQIPVTELCGGSFFLTRSWDVKLNETFFDNKVTKDCFVCCTVDILDPKT